MEGLDYWRLCYEVTVIQAALLIVGVDPSSEEGTMCEERRPHEQPRGYGAAKAALCHSILSGELPANVRRRAWQRGWDEAPRDGHDVGRLASMVFERSLTNMDQVTNQARSIAVSGVIYRAEPDWSLTTVDTDSLRKWLRWRGVQSGFFFPQARTEPDYLDPGHARYAPKLAAAVRAWQAVQDPQGKHPKQALTKWLREHAVEFGLSDEEGKPNELGIEECAKVANWQPGGGAPKTPGA